MWRNRGAFTTFVATWVALVVLTSLLLSMLLAVLGAARVAGVLLMPMALLFSTVFYVSQLFAFNDTFGPSPEAGVAGAPDAPPNAPAP